MKKINFLMTGLLAVCAQMAGAHPGHGVSGHGSEVLHPLLSSEHALLLGAVGVAALLMRQYLGADSDRRDGE